MTRFQAAKADAGATMTSPRAEERTGHVDPFARHHLPPRTLWPTLDFRRLPELAYPPRVNCAAELLDRTVERGDGGRTVFVHADGDWTYARLNETANRIANVLVDDAGLVPGNRVLLRGPNNPMMAACWFAVLKAGGIVVCTMPLLRSRELTHIIEKAQVALALCDHRGAADLESAAQSAPVLSRIIRFGDDGPESLEGLARARPATFSAVSTAADDVALIAFTSGTTGKAKGTMHFHRDVLAICDCFPRHVLQATPDALFCGSPAFAFTYGLGGILLFPMRIGAATLLLEQASPPLLLEAIRRHQATVCFTAPTAYRAMAQLASRADLASLRRCVSAGETLPASTYEQWRSLTGQKIIDGIGATELLHIFISASDGDIRAGSTGRPVPGYEAKVVDEHGEDVASGEVGRLAVRGPTGCRYLDDHDRQRAYVQRGWNITGDSYRVDEDGYFWYQARSDDMIISSGYNLSGPEVENVLLEHPDVRECGVIGVPDPDRGQVVKAFIVLRDGAAAGPVMEKALQDFVKSQIAPYKYPRRIEFVNTLPRTETGKLQRFRLREEKEPS